MAHHALVIGVSKSEVDAHVPTLPFAHADAHAMHRLLAQPGPADGQASQPGLGYGERAHLLLNPSAAEVWRKVDEIRKAVRAGDTWVCYFAGHGLQVGSDQYLLLHGAHLGRLQRGSGVGNDVLSLADLMADVAEWPPVNSLYVLDACRKPLHRPGERSTAEALAVQAVLAGVVARDLRLRRRGAGPAAGQEDAPAAVVVNACQDGERAYELEALQRGQFSYALECWLRQGLQDGQARLLGQPSLAQLHQALQALAQQYPGYRHQTPCVVPEAGQVLLWRPPVPPAPAPARPAPPAPPAAGPHGLLDVAHLMENFERQLANRHWSEPLDDCCVATLALMGVAGVKPLTLAMYRQRLSAAMPRPPAQAPAAARHPCPLPDMAQDGWGVYADLKFKGVVQRFRWIEPGSFLMGSERAEQEAAAQGDEKVLGWLEDESPRHRVKLMQGFWLADTACTQALWLAVVGGENPSLFKRKDDLPVERVSWDDVMGQFMPKLQGLLPAGVEATLPTEAQWEYACRAVTKTAFSFGEQINPEQVNYDGNRPYNGGAKGQYREKTVPVKALPANEWGLYQMHGNVWEWCFDSMRTYAEGEVVDALGAIGDGPRALRGGSWCNHAGLVRSAFRSRNGRGYRDGLIGFRVALRFKPSQGR